MEEEIKLITSKKALEGTCYIEFLPGKFDNTRFWSEESVFLEEEPMGFIEPIIIKHFPDYDHFGFQDLSKEVWFKIIHDLEQLNNNVTLKDKDYIRTICGFYYSSSESDFFESFEENNKCLNRLLKDLISWLIKALQDYGQVAILGI